MRREKGSQALLRYSADLRPLGAVSLALGCTLAAFFLDAGPAGLAAWWLLCLALHFPVPCAQHAHAHLNVFRQRPLNFLYEVVLAQLGGFVTPEWELQHNRGHHRSYLTPRQDVAGVVHPKTGREMSIGQYMLRGNLLIFTDSLKIAAQEKESDYWARRLLGHALLQAGLALLALWVSPARGFFFVVLPALIMRAYVWWASYHQHHGATCEDVYSGAVTTLSETPFTRFMNYFTFNSGHHTAHHEKPTLHWSLLPARTKTILPRIPEHCLSGRSAKKKPLKNQHLAPNVLADAGRGRSARKVLP